jgi:hypothetical protein
LHQQQKVHQLVEIVADVMVRIAEEIVTRMHVVHDVVDVATSVYARSSIRR